MYKEIELKQIHAKGWIAEFLKTQAKGITGHLDQLGEPFSGIYWDEDDVEVMHQQSRFLGGLNSKNDAWVPYEQTGYWIDGMVRTAHLLDDAELMKKAAPKVYNPIKYAHEDGFIGPAFLKDDMVWAHSVYFRALMAEYSATGDESILEALKKHYLRVPLKNVYAKRDDLRIITVRDVCDIEGALWVYGRTGDKRFLQMAEDSYLEFNRLFTDDRGSAPHCKSRALTLKGMLSDDPADSNHGVTYCEVCKLAAILHLYTGKLQYKEAAVKAFEKVYRDNMIVDGVISSSEYLNGNKSSRAVHEACDVSDFTWAVGYLFMITGDSKYGDWIENAVFNGGIGCMDDELNNHQYFSCPNQVICDDNSNHADFYKGEAWMSYTPTEVMGCCAGNINRFMPNYVCRSWMGQDNGICAFLYSPSTLNTQINGVSVQISEETAYPFRNTVRFTITPEKPVSFCFKGRIPGWAKGYSLTVNGKKAKALEENGFYVIDRKFKAGDMIEVTFEDEVCFVPNAGGVSVKKGALLYALPIKERVVTGQKERGLGDPRFAHYGLYPDSAWNYALSQDTPVEYIENEMDAAPWKSTASKSVIRVQGVELPEWKIEEADSFRQQKHPRKRGKVIKKHCLFTPELPDMKKTEIGQEVTLEMVPYCTTRLRIAIFPIKEMLDSGEFGRMVTLQLTENVGYYHFAHSYVRGNWRNKQTSAPVILAKSCHDLDIINWLVDAKCTHISSYGSLNLFREENAPQGSTKRCRDCDCADECAFNCYKLYTNVEYERIAGLARHGHLGQTPNEIIRALDQDDEPLGRCVYYCDNDVFDNQIVNMSFENGVHAQFMLTAFSEHIDRQIRICCEKGEIYGNLDGKAVHSILFGQSEETVCLQQVEEQYASHGGGDMGIVQAIIKHYVNGMPCASEVEQSVSSHLMCFAAENSAINNGITISCSIE